MLVKVEVAPQPLGQRTTVCIVPEVDGLIFDTAPESFNEHVVERAASAIHAHANAGSLHAPDAETALQAARDVYTRRAEGVSVWVVRSSEIVASDPDDAESFFGSIDKPYRHATHYEIPDEVGKM